MLGNDFGDNGVIEKKMTFTAVDMMNGNFQERQTTKVETSPTDLLDDKLDDSSCPYCSMDVLCGTNNYNHPGNRRFRSIIDANLQRYVDAPARADKTKVVCAVLEEILNVGCRFLKQDNKTKEWQELDTQAAKTKVGHALRVKSRFLPKSKDVLDATTSLQNDILNHHLPNTITSASTFGYGGGGAGDNNADHIRKKARLTMFLQDDGLKKPIHPQQYQYQFTTENARLTMSNELLKMEELFTAPSQYYGNLEPSPVVFNAPTATTSRDPVTTNNNSTEQAPDDASDAGSDDSDFLERINELPLEGGGGSLGGGNGGMSHHLQEDIRAPDDVRSEDIISLLDFATAL